MFIASIFSSQAFVPVMGINNNNINNNIRRTYNAHMVEKIEYEARAVTKSDQMERRQSCLENFVDQQVRQVAF